MKKILSVGVSLVVVGFVLPIVWFTFSTHAYFEGRCWCSNRQFYYLNKNAPLAQFYPRVWNVWVVWIYQHLPEHGGKAQRITCINNLKQIGLAFRIWAGDHDDQFPFNVSTNAGGTLEFCSVDKDGFDLNTLFHFQVMSNELNSPKVLVCPDDKRRSYVTNFALLQSCNVTYRVRSGTNISDATSRTVVAVCPIDGNIVYADGEVMGK